MTHDKLQFLLETVHLERTHLDHTNIRLFLQPMTAERALTLRTDQDLAERVDAFVARFGRPAFCSPSFKNHHMKDLAHAA